MYKKHKDFLTNHKERMRCLLNFDDSGINGTISGSTTGTPLISSSSGSMQSKKVGINIAFLEKTYIEIGDIIVSFKGTIHNINDIAILLNIEYESVEQIIVAVYEKCGIQYLLQILDGVFSIIIFDRSCMKEYSMCYVATDAFSISPIYITNLPENRFEIGIQTMDNKGRLVPGTYSCFTLSNKVCASWSHSQTLSYYTLPHTITLGMKNIEYWKNLIEETIYDSIKKRCWNNHASIICYIQDSRPEICDLLIKLCRKFSDDFTQSDCKIYTYTVGVPGNEPNYNVLELIKKYNTQHTHLSVRAINSKTVYEHMEKTGPTIFHCGGIDELFGFIKERSDYFSPLKKQESSLIDFDLSVRRGIQEFFKKIEGDTNYQYLFLDKQLIQTVLSIPIEVRYNNRFDLV